MIHTVEHQLQWTPLGSDDHVNSSKIVFETFFELVIKQGDKRNQADTQGKQQHTHQRSEWIGKDVFATETEYVHRL